MQYKIKIFFILPILGLLFLPFVSTGQTFNTQNVFSSELGIEIIPTYPKPNDTVFINLSLYTDDLNSAEISWYENGKLILTGRGATKHSFITGNPGQEKVVKIEVKLLSGSSFSKTFTINPANVDIVWEADSYVPPFYKGKALHSRQGFLKIVALPQFIKNGTAIAPEKLVYEWSTNISAYQSQSGYGRNILVLNGSTLGREERIEVLVRDPVSGAVAQSFINIRPTEPEIVFYENNPYYGVNFERALVNSFDLQTDEVQILSVPYHLSKESVNNIKYEWKLNGSLIDELYNSRTAIFRKPEGQGGTSSINLTIENLNRMLQRAESTLVFKFKEDEN